MILRMSSLFLRTLREDPADAEVPSHRLLVRAGYIRRTAPGIYTWLPIGLKVVGRTSSFAVFLAGTFVFGWLLGLAIVFKLWHVAHAM